MGGYGLVIFSVMSRAMADGAVFLYLRPPVARPFFSIKQAIELFLRPLTERNLPHSESLILFHSTAVRTIPLPIIVAIL